MFETTNKYKQVIEASIETYNEMVIVKLTESNIKQINKAQLEKVFNIVKNEFIQKIFNKK